MVVIDGRERAAEEAAEFGVTAKKGGSEAEIVRRYSAFTSRGASFRAASHASIAASHLPSLM